MTEQPKEADVPAAEESSAGSEAAPQPCDSFPLATRIESILMTADRAMPESRLGDLLGIPGQGRGKVIQEAVDELNAFYDDTGRSFRIDRVAGGYQILTRPEFGGLLLRLHTDRTRSRLSPAALETLAILAYRQPIMRAEIEAIRGVACGEVLRGLMERRLCKIVGRAEELGRPMLYGTSQEFLHVFGLASIDDLPAVEGLERKPAYVAPKPVAEASSDSEESEAARATDEADDAADSNESGDAEAVSESSTDGASESDTNDASVVEVVSEEAEVKQG